jgi:hypothetical protein
MNVKLGQQQLWPTGRHIKVSLVCQSNIQYRFHENAQVKNRA